MSLKTRNKVDPAFNMSSLADIIFLLLIFFLLTSSVINTATPVKRPSSNTTTRASSIATITVDKNKQYSLDGQAMSKPQLRSAIKVKIAGEDKPRLLLNIDKTVDVQTLIDLYDMATDLKFEMQVATEKRKN